MLGITPIYNSKKEVIVNMHKNSGMDFNGSKKQILIHKLLLVALSGYLETHLEI